MDIPSDMPEWPEGVPAPLVERTHQISPRSTVTEMDSSRIRVRREQISEIELIRVSLNMMDFEFDNFQTFFIDVLRNGELAFVLETRDFPPDPLTERNVTRILAFTEGQYSITHSDNLYALGAVLEVIDSETIDTPLS